jgi:hypothetical protein
MGPGLFCPWGSSDFTALTYPLVKFFASRKRERLSGVFLRACATQIPAGVVSPIRVNLRITST